MDHVLPQIPYTPDTTCGHVARRLAAVHTTEAFLYHSHHATNSKYESPRIIPTFRASLLRYRKLTAQIECPKSTEVNGSSINLEIHGLLHRVFYLL